MTGSSLPTRPLTRSELVAIDCLVAALLTAAYLTAALSSAWSPADAAHPAWLVSCVIVLFMGPPIAVRRLWPMPVFIVVMVASVLALALGVLREPFVAASLAGYTAAVAERRLSRRGWTILGCVSLILLFLSVSAGMARPWARPLGVILPGLALVGAAWTLGIAVRERREYATWLSEHRMAQAVSDERLRIAREVHDIVTHNLGVITVKAAVARHVAETQPGEALESLRMIEEVSRAALNDMRQVLHVLRAAPRDGGDDGSDDLPQELRPGADDLPQELLPGADDLQTLVQGAGAAGLDIEWEVTGTERLPAGAGLSTYRILQEALTNVIKHAGPTHCQLAVHCTDDEVVIDVRDDGEPDHRPINRVPTAAGGYGLVGMRERVAMYGGELVAGPRDGGGYHLRVRLPYRSVNRPAGRSS